MDETVQLIDRILKDKLKASHVDIIDESYLHRGHKAAGGGGHYSVRVVSPQFEGVNLIDQRRLVYGALDDQINGKPKLIHALQIQTLTPAQWAEQSGSAA
ncbi:MAG: BolA/IbaG family iron-sulfur metabolism protein [Nitrospinaceae bacterium]|nr:BolA family transcriptional regulator [Nitrospinaceae bacterium]NIR57868.1 BolA family transcriptional regulator [Nitrospinaceae bacterium]NIS88327.1 BolA family transcriptional regulator [Nitrospinaceae bacterium]NIT85205.1 BolA family transcriptional regulator [Nitrospinaceae bacterium]NIU47355.1 BolA family transcriptional regulator [Nitrospinaceae bacterium]